MPETEQLKIPTPIVLVAAWVLPGAGYFILGQRSRGLTVGITILLLFFLGLLIGGIKVVESPPNYTTAGLMEHPWFIPQILAGPLTLATANIAQGASYKTSHARVNEIGTLYTAVAGMLNLLAIIDSSYRAVQRERPA